MINFNIKNYKILEACEREYGEIGDFLIEDEYISFTVYLGYFEEPIKEILIDHNTKLIFIDKFEDPFYTLSYKILNIQDIA
ncbi:MAG: hypothetical protein KatS3mg027_1320 [Bacteroidia bacterium]|nr:MAG: hypothetical protein KatS3mg027_1320 [Bacteroidia bacterium]